MRPEELTSPTDRLDRAWAATRPAEPSAEALDALWAQASARIEVRPAPLRFHDDRPSTGRRLRTVAIVGLVLVQAAAVLMAVALRRGEDGIEGPKVVSLSKPTAPAPKFNVNVEVGEYSFSTINLDGRVDKKKFDDSASVGTQLADSTPHDLFNQLEGMATP